ncbi:MAG: molybdopterin molybdotransferase MoeA [Nitrospirae bacterium]|nr:molybdopterin molybdotransferase MoeA [Nitrospirota bacterium]
MLGREDVISPDEALSRLYKALITPDLPETVVALALSANRIISRDIVSPENLPGFDRSTMDGYAIRASDSFGATDGYPSYLKVTGEVLMGECPSFEIGKSETARIATGGMLPKGADSVVMFEQTNVINEEMIEVLKPTATGENVIQSGEDCKKGETVMTKGHKIRPHDMGALAGLGITKIWVYELPKVAIIATGDEVVPASQDVMPGQVRDINSYSLTGLVETHGGSAVIKGIFRDNYEDLMKAAGDSLKEADIIIITGGSSVGTKDVTAKVINDLGKPGVLFHGVSIKPGKPMIGGIVDGKPLFGLPGHPAAVIVCFELFIKPVLRTLSGETETLNHRFRKTVQAKLSKNISSGAGREDHVRVLLEEKNGELYAIPILGKSGLITTLVKADGTVVIPLRKTGLEQGTEVEVELF